MNRKIKIPIPIVEYALYIALRAHEGQTRKDSAHTPYIVHPVSVALLVSRFTTNDHVLVAALLHDLLEDTKYTTKQMKKDFGTKVCRLVTEVSEPSKPGLSWAVRKDKYLDTLSTASHEALLIACADKITNLRAMRSAYLVDGELLWKKFAPQSTPEQRIEFYRRVWLRIKSVWPHCPLLRELHREINRTATAIKLGRKLKFNNH